MMSSKSSALCAAALVLSVACFAAPAAALSASLDPIAIPFPCPIPLCAAPPPGCVYVPSDVLGPDGCPKFPCGILKCLCKPCPLPLPFCIYPPTIKDSFGCPICLPICCPIPVCAAPPPGCYYKSSNELDAFGCPKFPCGILTCCDDNPFSPTFPGLPCIFDIQPQLTP